MNPFMTLSRITKLKKESKELSNKIVEIKSSSNTPTNPTTSEEPLIWGAWTWKEGTNLDERHSNKGTTETRPHICEFTNHNEVIYTITDETPEDELFVPIDGVCNKCYSYCVCGNNELVETLYHDWDEYGYCTQCRAMREDIDELV